MYRIATVRRHSPKQIAKIIFAGIATLLLSLFLMNFATGPGAHALMRETMINQTSTATAKPSVNSSSSSSLPATEPKLEKLSATPEQISLSPVADSDLATLKGRNLLIPVAGVAPSQLKSSFNDARSEGRVHQAIDIRADQGTPVLATADGKVKLHSSSRGGLMVYQTDSSVPFVYCYGHLQKYADNLSDGQVVKRGDVIAYVGDTGNAGPGNYHLHFGISRMSAPGKWSGGFPLDPYPLLAGR